MPIVFSAAAMLDTYTGHWSPYTLLIAVVMGFSGLILLVVLLLLALTGRISTRPQQGMADEDDGGFTLFEERTLTRSEKDGRRKAIQKERQETPPEKPRRKTGWQFLVGAIGCSVPPAFIFSWIDNPLGRMRSATFGAALCVILLAGQVYLVVRFVMCQRRLGR